MATAIDKLFKGYTVKEIEEILFKDGFEAQKRKKKRYSRIIKDDQNRKKEVLAL